MDFTLRYRGSLPPFTAREKRVEEKHAIRTVFRRQLGELWKLEPTLSYWLKLRLPEATLERKALVIRPAPNQADWLNEWCRVGSYRFVPMATRHNRLACRLAIKFLRYGHPGDLVDNAGDLDNRLKVLLDALRMPHNESELPPPQGPPDDDYFYCLMEDDRLITSLTVESDRLLEPAAGGDESLVDIWLGVTVKPLVVTPLNIGF